MLEEIAAGIPAAAERASTDAFLLWKVQFDLNDELMVIRVTELLTNYHDFKNSDDGGSDNDWTFMPARVRAAANAEEAEGRYTFVRMLMDHDGAKRGEIVQVPPTEAKFICWRHAAERVSEEKAAEWFDHKDDPTFVCSVGDGLRVASMLHGGAHG